MLALFSAAADVDVQFIIIVDDPAADIGWLQDLERTTMHGKLRVRKNATNEGASASRNNGMRESAAEWILFLDDDVIPQADILDAYVTAICHPANADYDGFVGYSDLPSKDEIFPTAFHFSHASFFWRAASIMDEMPWGVTANSLFRRIACSSFNTAFLKTGGGEDIDFCLKLRRQPLKTVPAARVQHPWWGNGSRWSGYKQVYSWAYGDGHLQDVYPNLTYRAAPNAMELCALILPTALLTALFNLHCARVLLTLSIAIVAADAWEGLETISDNSKEPQCTGWKRQLAGLESSFIQHSLNLGRIHGHLSRGRFWASFGRRFDWFGGYQPSIVKDEQHKAWWKLGLYAAVFGLALLLLVVA